MQTRAVLAEKMAGEISLSENPGQTIKKWRGTFGVSQTDLAEQLDVSPSVISDYESGRRESPGTKTVRRMVQALLDIDEAQGGSVLRKYSSLRDTPGAILDIRELYEPVPARDIVETLDGDVLAAEDDLDRELKGYTVVDSLKAITELSSFDYLKMYGWSSERALIFTGITYGRSPMVAVRVHPMKPAMVVYHQPKSVDDLATKLAGMEGIPLVSTTVGLESMIEDLRKV
ncbi:transcriptional regulator [Thermoplasmatales archaeon SW_10_69_26]|jgi:putative transcriptional regulator|nr:MAG: transcriptional regulator [Thermoplasmatales archaeon SW_10_69_26]